MTRLGLTAILSGLAAAPAAAQWTVTNLHPPGATRSIASGISGTKQVGEARFNGIDSAVLWSLYADCDHSTAPPVLAVNDFICFQTRFAQGCP